MVSGLEISALVAALAIATWLMSRQRAGAFGAVLMLGAIAATVAGSLGKHSDLQTRADQRAEVLAEIPTLEREADGFVRSDSCKACHPREYETWHDSYHRSMTQVANADTVRGTFDDIELTEGEYVYSLRRTDDGFFVEMVDFEWERERTAKGMELGPMAGRPRTKKRIVMTTGSHYMQTYWYPSKDGRELLNFPFIYLFEEARWVPRSEVFLRPPDAEPMRQRWNDNCLGCHTTFGQPKRSESGWDTRVAELGIACEVCHGPGEEHVALHRDPFERYLGHFADDEPDPTIVNPARLPAARSAEVCGQCHSKSWINDFGTFNSDGIEYRPGDELSKSKTIALPRSNPDHPWLRESIRRDARFIEQFFWGDGMIRVSGREYNGLVESACFGGGELSCLSCHSLHSDEPVMHPAEGGSGDPSCAGCHAEIAANVSAHSHHDAESSGSSCVNCHMPYTSYGLMRALRSHLIDSPTVAASVETGRPNACNQCHLDKTLGWTSDRLAQWYGIESPSLEDADVNTSAALRWMLEGDAAQRALMGWSFGWAPAQAASGTDWLAPYLAILLRDPYATVRYIAAKSLRSLAGFESLDYDYIAGEDDRVKKAKAAFRSWKPPSGDARPAIMLLPKGLDSPAVTKMLDQRDNHPVDLKE